MTTLIYYFLMALILFTVPQILVKHLNGTVKIHKNTRFLFYAALISFSWYFLPKALVGIREVNFLQHMIGGGVSVGLVAIYILNELKEKLEYVGFGNFWVHLFLVFAMVSSFGVCNEILEFILDWQGIGIFSADRYDTWFDLVANTSGALCVFLVYRIFSMIFHSSKR